MMTFMGRFSMGNFFDHATPEMISAAHFEIDMKDSPVVDTLWSTFTKLTGK